MNYLLVFFLTIVTTIVRIKIVIVIEFKERRNSKMDVKFTLSLDAKLRTKVKSEAALNEYKNMNLFIIDAIEEKIQRIEKEKSNVTHQKQ